MVKVTLTIVVLNNREEFLQFIDSELCHLEESIEVGGLRTLSFEYTFQDYTKDKELFRIGNKIWVQGDVNIQDSLYVINTEVKQDIYQENSFTVDLEEVLVELNYAPVFSQTELSNTVFHTKTTNGKQEVVVDWNALNYWFGDYYNIGVVQDCISEYASRISITGTINRMTLLRQIEEETGNVFVTRYEKDLINNTIHRYLDFLNPININKNWQLNLEYDFYDTDNTVLCYDSEGNLVAEDKDWEVTRFENSKYDDESVSPDDPDTGDETDYDTEQSETYDSESQEIYDYEKTKDYTPRLNINPEHCVIRLVNNNYQLMNTDGEIYVESGELDPLQWSCVTAGLDPTGNPKYLISLLKIGNIFGIAVNEKTYAIQGIGEKQLPYLPEFKTLDYGKHISIATDCEISYSKIPDESYLEIYNTNTQQVLYRTRLNIEIGKVHSEILDFGENLENIEFNINETETYSAISPIINPDTDSSGKSLSRTDINTIINEWQNLEVQKGDVIPMMVEKFNIEADDLNGAKSILEAYDLTSNYWVRPLKPTDNTDSTPKQYEFYRAIAYWRAPYTKHAGEMFVRTEKTDIEYSNIHTRPDTRDELSQIGSPKIGNTETSDENKYAIYNQVALYLKEHETPNIDIELDVANLRGQEYNNYDIHDKIYLKLVNTQELITARVTKTTKEAHDIAKNTIEISNYRNVNTIKTLPHETVINASNVKFKYPNSTNFTVRLENTEVDDSHPQYPSGKLLTFTLYKLENGSSTLTGKVYTKLTDAYGNATINMKYDPGDYEMAISFYGDEEYLETSVTVNVNVGGTIPAQNLAVNNTRDDPTISSSSKTTSKTNKKTKKVKQYWTKCGLSPDKKHKQIVSIAQPSSADAGKYKYQQLWKTVFKNYCPNCKKWGGLRFDGGKANKCITSSTYGVHYKPGVPEHEVTCIYCDSDYCGVTGQEKSHGHISRLKTVKKPVKSSKTEFNKLVKGKLLHSTKTVTVKTKQNVNKQNDRKVKAAGINKKVKEQALAIVKNKKGYNAARAIVSWIDNHISYAGYPNFVRSPETVLSKQSGNCCDVTRLCLQMLDVAGCTEYFKMEYVHVPGHVYARLTTKKTGKTRPVDCASDYSGAWGYICRNYRGLHEYKSTYPKLPF